MIVWDYFMRRKWLLLTVLAVFMLSGVVSGYFLQHSDTYTVDATVLNRPEDVTEDANSIARVQVPILSEEEANAVAIAKAENNMAIENTNTNASANTNANVASAISDANNDTDINPSTEASTSADASTSTDAVAHTDTSDTEVDVPLTSGTSETSIVAAWQDLFSTWQQVTMNIFGIMVLAVVVISVVRLTLWRKIR